MTIQLAFSRHGLVKDTHCSEAPFSLSLSGALYCFCVSRSIILSDFAYYLGEQYLSSRRSASSGIC